MAFLKMRKIATGKGFMMVVFIDVCLLKARKN